MNLQDLGVSDMRQFARLAGDSLTRRAAPAVGGVGHQIRVNVPQIFVDVDRAKAKALGV